MKCPLCEKEEASLKDILTHIAQVHTLDQLAENYKNNDLVSADGVCMICHGFDAKTISSLSGYLIHIGGEHRMAERHLEFNVVGHLRRLEQLNLQQIQEQPEDQDGASNIVHQNENLVSVKVEVVSNENLELQQGGLYEGLSGNKRKESDKEVEALPHCAKKNKPGSNP